MARHPPHLFSPLSDSTVAMISDGSPSPRQALAVRVRRLPFTSRDPLTPRRLIDSVALLSHSQAHASLRPSQALIFRLSLSSVDA